MHGRCLRKSTRAVYAANGHDGNLAATAVSVQGAGAVPDCWGSLCLAVFVCLLHTGLSPAEAQTRDESWGGVLQEVVLSGTADPGDFMRQAVSYANDKCWGTLAAR